MPDTTEQTPPPNIQLPQVAPPAGNPPGGETSPAQAAMPQTPPAQPQQPHRKVPIWAPLMIILFLAAFAAGLLVRKTQNGPEAPAAIPTTPIPTVQESRRTVSPVATSSAYLELQSGVASLSAELNQYSVEDQSVSPPSLVLPLGFSNN